MEHKDFEAYLKETTKGIVIFGTGKMGDYLYETCLKANISVRAFCDNNEEKWNQTVHDLPILSLVECKKRYATPIFLISLLNAKHQESIAMQLEMENCNEYYSLLDCLDHLDFIEIENLWDKMGILQLQKAKYQAVDSPVTYADFISVSITEQCTLRCRDCSAFIPYHKVQNHRKKEDIFLYLDKIDAFFDEIIYLNISGGEALTHPDVYEILEYALTKKSIQYVFLYTNGTVIPKKEELMKLDSKRFGVFCSNYGELSTKRTELFRLLDELQIGYFSPEEMEWLDCTKLDFRNKTLPELKQAYKECWNLCIIVVDGKLFRCSQGVVGHLLKAIPQSAIQYVDLLDDTKSKKEVQTEIRKYLHGTEHLDVCNWCTGKTETEKVPIPIAVQIKGTLPYQRYDD